MDKHKYELNRQRAEDKRLMDKYNKHVGILPGNKSFAIITLDRRGFKNFKDISSWGKHVTRCMVSENVNPELIKYNRVLIGKDLLDEGFSLGDLVKEHLSCVKLRKNACLARSMVLTGSHKFQDNLLPEEKEKWINENIKFLKDKYGDDCIYAVLHQDETSMHIHALISAVEYEPEKRKFFLRNNKYFGGREKLISLQDEYSEHLSKSFNCFIRGRRGSKAKHIDLKTFYNIMNEKIDTNNLTPEQVEKIVKGNFLLNKRYQEQQATIEALQKNPKMDELLDEIEELKSNNTVYKQVIKDLADNLGIDREIIIQLADKHAKENKKVKGKERRIN